MRILALFKEADGFFRGYVETEEQYRHFIIQESGLKFDDAFPKSDYTGLEHFAGVTGKFDPYMFFLGRPVEVNRLKLKEIDELYDYLYGRRKEER